MTASRWALAGAVVALVAVFAAISVSLVQARRPLDRNVSQSFDAVAPGLGGTGTTVSSHGCHKTSYDFYDCRIAARSGTRRHPVSFALRYRLSLTEDGCWTARPNPIEALYAVPPRLRQRFLLPRGCTAGARPSG